MLLLLLLLFREELPVALLTTVNTHTHFSSIGIRNFAPLRTASYIVLNLTSFFRYTFYRIALFSLHFCTDLPLPFTLVPSTSSYYARYYAFISKYLDSTDLLLLQLVS